MKTFSYIFTSRKRSLGQSNIFRSVCEEFCSQGGGLPQCMLRYPLGLGRHPPTRQAPPNWTRQAPPWDQAGMPRDQAGTPCQTRHPPHSRACSEIWSMSGRYASYWNAILLGVRLECVCVCVCVCVSVRSIRLNHI